MNHAAAAQFAAEVLESEHAGAWTVTITGKSTWLGWTEFTWVASSNLDAEAGGLVEEYQPGQFRVVVRSTTAERVS